MKTRVLVLLSGVLFLAAATISIAKGCPETSSCSMMNGTVSVQPDGTFAFPLYPSWAMKTDPSWVTLQFNKMGSVNIKQDSVYYTPSYWQYQDCEGSATSTCHGTLDDKNYDGNVQTLLNVGVDPDNCGGVYATFIPAP